MRPKTPLIDPSPLVCSIAQWSFTKFVLMTVSESEIAPAHGFLGLIHRNTEEILQKSSEPLDSDA